MTNRNKDKKKLNSGMITVEATISLTTFVFVILMILSVLNVCTAQAKVGIAINSTAKELSQYSYLYALTGLNASEAKLAAAGKNTKDGINSVLDDVNTVFTEIDNLGNKGKNAAATGDISGFLNSIEGSYATISTSGGNLKNAFDSVASDPKKLAFGLAKIAATDGLNIVKSKLIAAPLSRALCKKNLVNVKGGDVEAYLKHLNFVPAANGSYFDGLDFGESTIFPSGSNEIRVVVSYKVKVIPFIPIDYEFKFTQSAVTQGWLAGESTYKPAEKQLETTGNESIWVSATITERSELIRHMGITEMVSNEGYSQTKGLTDVQLYNAKNNEFAAIFSMNPLYSAEGSANLTLNDISETAITEQIELLCGKIKSSTEGKKTVTVTEKDKKGNTTKKDYKCEDASNKIIIVIPEDDGLKAKMEEYLKKCDTKGVTVEFQTGYGTGVRNVEVKSEDNKDK